MEPRGILSRALRALVVSGLLALTLGGSAEAARRALVIGIDAYEEVEPLRKAKGDAEAIGGALERLGFEVERLLDVDRRGMARGLSRFLDRIEPGDITFVHFSGHGVEIDGENYLLPADVPRPSAGERELLKAEGFRLTDLVAQVKAAGARTRLFVIDACRDEPFGPEGTRGFGLGRGLARVEAPEGTFIMYSAGYRQTALDRLSETDAAVMSVYTRVLVDELGRPHASITDVAKEVRIKVARLAQTAGHVQNPAYYDELTEKFSLVTAPEEPSPAATKGKTSAEAKSAGVKADEAPREVPAPKPDAVAVPSLSEREAYELARSVGTAGAWEAFVKAYPKGFLADLARAERNKLTMEVAKAAPAERREADGSVEAPRVEEESGADGAAAMKDAVAGFVTDAYLGGDLTDGAHIRSIYAAKVDYYGKPRVPVSTIVRDKGAYAARWASLDYDLTPGSLRVGRDGALWVADFSYDFLAAERSKRIRGRATATLKLRADGDRLTIVGEEGKVLERETLDLASNEVRTEREGDVGF